MTTRCSPLTWDSTAHSFDASTVTFDQSEVCLEFSCTPVTWDSTGHRFDSTALGWDQTEICVEVTGRGFEASLYAHLQDALSGLVGSRIYPLVLPDGAALPALTYQVISLEQASNLTGRDKSLRRYRVQIDCWARTHAAAAALKAALLARMDVAAASFRSELLPTGFDAHEPEARITRGMNEFSCWFKET